MEDKKDRIPRSSNKARRDQDREKKGKGSVRLADSSSVMVQDSSSVMVQDSKG